MQTISFPGRRIFVSDIDGTLDRSAVPGRNYAPEARTVQAVQRVNRDVAPVVLVTGQPLWRAEQMRVALGLPEDTMLGFEFGAGIRLASGKTVCTLNPAQRRAYEAALPIVRRYFEGLGIPTNPMSFTMNGFLADSPELFRSIARDWDGHLLAMKAMMSAELWAEIQIPDPNPVDASFNLQPRGLGKGLFVRACARAGVEILAAAGDTSSDVPLIQAATRLGIACHDIGCDPNHRLVAAARQRPHHAVNAEPHGLGLADAIEAHWKVLAA